MSLSGRRIAIRGTVQGVGFRPWVYHLAHAAGVRGWVVNDTAGVVVHAFAEPPTLDALVERLRHDAPPPARVRTVAWEAIGVQAVTGFRILPSHTEGARQSSIPADLATCPTCLAEVLDPRSRRHGYAFTNCTACGPRFSITQSVPYDRAATTMARFRMCPTCAAEYAQPGDRRFHAEPNACPDCGPQLRLLDATGAVLDTAAPLDAAARQLLAGTIVAVKGLGGYHLACDATNERAVAQLRRRKQRSEKPFAVMVADLAAARALAQISDAEAHLLTGPERPIVLLRAHTNPLGRSVAPGNSLLGLMLPYTPLHHLLLRAVARPLVMTSGNRSDEPIACDDADAVRRLGDVADSFLAHDRDIANRTDDSVIRLIGEHPLLMRRSRGFVPQPIHIATLSSEPILACGAQLKNAFCITSAAGAGTMAYLGAHVGDLDNLETYDSYTEAIARMESFLGVRPRVVAHDLHPDYLSTRYAMERHASRRIGVQHHHAHVVAVMAEHRLPEPVLGIVYDGTGYGSDGAAWGAEILLARRSGFERLATTRPVLLAGGDAAIREVWRIGLALLEDAFGGDPPLQALPLFAAVPPQRLRAVRQMLQDHVNVVWAHGMGRFFDGFGAIGLARAHSTYEAQVASAWEQVAAPTEDGRYGFVLHTDVRPWQLDLRRTVRQAVGDVLAGRHADTVAARFHNTLVAATQEIVAGAVRAHGALPIVLAGGCMQNARLTAGLLAALGQRHAVYLNERVPASDGGIALGQAAIAAAQIGDASCA